MAISETEQSLSLSPRNINIKKKAASIYLQLAEIDPTKIIETHKNLSEAINLSPTDPQLYYELGLTLIKMGEKDLALAMFEKSIELKPNYTRPRYMKAILLIEKGSYEEAKKELEYILEKISPKDERVKKLLKKLDEQNLPR